MDVFDRIRSYFGKQFSHRLQQWMKDNNKTQRDFCAEAGVNKNSVTGWKQGKHIPRDNEMQKICKTFNIDIQEFLPFLAN